jgi:Domain of unknown function (DUF1844)
VSEERPPSTDEKHRMGFVALVLLLREMASSLLSDGRRAEACALIDSIDALRTKTKGNLDTEETSFLDDVLYQLQMAAVQTPAESAESSPPGGEAKAEGPPDPSTPEAPR